MALGFLVNISCRSHHSISSEIAIYRHMVMLHMNSRSHQNDLEFIFLYVNSNFNLLRNVVLLWHITYNRRNILIILKVMLMAMMRGNIIRHCVVQSMYAHISSLVLLHLFYFPSPENWKLTRDQEWKITSLMVPSYLTLILTWLLIIFYLYRTRSLGYIQSFSPTNHREMYPDRETEQSIRW